MCARLHAFRCALPFWVVAALALCVAPAIGQTISPIGPHALRRMSIVSEGELALRRARAAMLVKDYERAYAEFRNALNLLGNEPSMTALREEARDGFAQSGGGACAAAARTG